MEFCRECNHLLNPIENRELKRLELECRNCHGGRREADPDNPLSNRIFTRQVKTLEEEKAIPFKDMGSDKASLHIRLDDGNECPVCGSSEAVFLQTAYKEKVVVYLICVQCGERLNPNGSNKPTEHT